VVKQAAARDKKAAKDAVMREKLLNQKALNNSKTTLRCGMRECRKAVKRADVTAECNCGRWALCKIHDVDEAEVIHLLEKHVKTCKIASIIDHDVEVEDGVLKAAHDVEEEAGSSGSENAFPRFQLSASGMGTQLVSPSLDADLTEEE